MQVVHLIWGLLNTGFTVFIRRIIQQYPEIYRNGYSLHWEGQFTFLRLLGC